MSRRIKMKKKVYYYQLRILRLRILKVIDEKLLIENLSYLIGKNILLIDMTK